MIRSIQLTKFPVLVASLSRVQLIIGMDTIRENPLNWKKPKSVALAVRLTQWESVDFPLRLSVCRNASYNKVWYIISDILKAGVVVSTISHLTSHNWLGLKANRSDIYL